MYVNGMGPAKGPLGPEEAPGARKADGASPGTRSDAPTGNRERADRVEISSQGRAMAEAADAGLSAEQVSWFRGRLDAGYYDAPEVMSETARRLLRSGDL